VVDVPTKLWLCIGMVGKVSVTVSLPSISPCTYVLLRWMAARPRRSGSAKF